MKKVLFICCALLTNVAIAQTIGLQRHDTGSLDDGYVLFAPISGRDTYLIDKCGKQINKWTSANRPGQAAYLLPNGDLLRTGNVNNSTFNAGGRGGLIERLDWNGNVLWSYTVSSTTNLQHHDVKMMPNGNVLIISWELKTAAQAIAAGRNPSQTATSVWSEKIIEVQPVGATGGNIVWEWHLWDHLTQRFDPTKPNYSTTANEPQLININFNATANQEDWIHLNAIDYNPALDQILLSSHNFEEVWIIDHSSTTTQAATHAGGNAGKGGDLLYRWGNPLAYGNGTVASQKLFGQHNAYWIENGFPQAGNIMIFNNGTGRNYSTVEIIDAPESGFNYVSTLPYGPAAVSYNYNNGNPHNLYAQNISGSQQLSNGNVLICNGPAGIFTEVTSTGVEVWKYTNPVNGTGIMTQGATPTQNPVFRASFYPSSYGAFTGRNLTPSATIEATNTLSANCTAVLSTNEPVDELSLRIYPNPAREWITISHPSAIKNQSVSIHNLQGQRVLRQDLSIGNTETQINTSTLKSGMYVIEITGVTKQQVLRFVVE